MVTCNCGCPDHTRFIVIYYHIHHRHNASYVPTDGSAAPLFVMILSLSFQKCLNSGDSFIGMGVHFLKIMAYGFASLDLSVPLPFKRNNPKTHLLPICDSSMKRKSGIYASLSYHEVIDLKVIYAKQKS